MGLNSKRNFEDSAKFFSALGNKKRVQIVQVLLDGEKCVTRINELMKLAQPDLSQHLNVLKRVGILVCCKCGNQRCYNVVNPDLMRTIIESANGYKPLPKK